jgi:HTH-type transcriptional regulator / antitoxin HipB
VELTKPIKLNLAEKLKDRRYRNAFFRARAQDDTAANIRELRERRELSQAELAKRAGMKQSAISRIEQAEYSSWTYRTLQRVAEALDARLVVFFEPAEEVIAKYEHTESVSFVSSGSSKSDKSVAQKVLQASIYACFSSILAASARGETTTISTPSSKYKSFVHADADDENILGAQNVR